MCCEFMYSTIPAVMFKNIVLIFPYQNDNKLYKLYYNAFRKKLCYFIEWCGITLSGNLCKSLEIYKNL